MATRLNRVDFGGHYPTLGSALSSPLAMTIYREIDHEWLRENVRGALSSLGLPNVYSKNPDDEDAQESAQIARGLEIISMSICDAIADCISNSSNVQGALAQYLQQNTVQGGSVNPSSSQSPLLGENLLSGSDCSSANIYAYCVQIVQLANRVIEDLYQLMESATNNLEVVAVITRTVPFFGTAIEIAQALQENLAEGYLGSYNAIIEQEIACDLFCLASQSCYLSIDMIRDYHRQKLSLSDENAWELSVQFITTGIFSGSLAVHGSMFVLWQTLAFTGTYGGYGISGILRLMEALENDSDNDYTLCDACPDCVYSGVYDFSNGPQCWVIRRDLGFTPSGYYDSLEGRFYSGDNNQLTDLVLDFPSPRNVTGLSFNGAVLNGGSVSQIDGYLKTSGGTYIPLGLSFGSSWSGFYANIVSIQIFVISTQPCYIDTVSLASSV